MSLLLAWYRTLPPSLDTQPIFYFFFYSIYFFIFGSPMQHVTRDQSHTTLQWMHRVLTSGPPGTSPPILRPALLNENRAIKGYWPLELTLILHWLNASEAWEWDAKGCPVFPEPIFFPPGHQLDHAQPPLHLGMIRWQSHGQQNAGSW